jgi:hypothetical protein
MSDVTLYRNFYIIVWQHTDGLYHCKMTHRLSDLTLKTSPTTNRESSILNAKRLIDRHTSPK